MDSKYASPQALTPPKSTIPARKPTRQPPAQPQNSQLHVQTQSQTHVRQSVQPQNLQLHLQTQSQTQLPELSAEFVFDLPTEEIQCSVEQEQPTPTQQPQQSQAPDVNSRPPPILPTLSSQNIPSRPPPADVPPPFPAVSNRRSVISHTTLSSPPTCTPLPPTTTNGIAGTTNQMTSVSLNHSYFPHSISAPQSTFPSLPSKSDLPSSAFNTVRNTTMIVNLLKESDLDGNSDTELKGTGDGNSRIFDPASLRTNKDEEDTSMQRHVFSADTLAKHTKKLQKNVREISTEEKVKEVYECKATIGPRVVSGRIYLTEPNKLLVLISTKKLAFKRYRVLSLETLVEISRRGEKSIKIISTQSNTIVLSDFVMSRDFVLNRIKGMFFGKSGNQALHEAVENRNYAKVKQIVRTEQGRQQLHVANRRGQTPLILSCINGDKEMLNILLSCYRENSDIDINALSPRGEHLLHVICRVPDLDDAILRTCLLFPGIFLNATTTLDGTTPLHVYCQYNHSLNCGDFMREYFIRYVNINSVTKQGETPLHKAVMNDKVRLFMVDSLVKAGALLDVKSGNGHTPLHYAIRMGHTDLVDKLLQSGSDITITNNDGKNATDIAQEEINLKAKSSRSSLSIQRSILLVQKLRDLLKKANVESYMKEFIKHGFYDYSTLSLINDSDLEEFIKLDKTQIKSLRLVLDEEKHHQHINQSLQKFKIATEEAQKVRQQFRALMDGDWEINGEELEFLEKKEKGSFGQVFRGRYRGNEVAIKILFGHDNDIEDFKKEIQILNLIDSPYLVSFYGASVEPYLTMVMEWCENGSLMGYLKKNLKLTWSTALSFASDMAEGMTVLHGMNPPIVHRDLKSQNLLVTSDLRVRVCDFGLSRPFDKSNPTFVGMKGTPAYTAPEVCIAGGMFTAKADVYSMGIVLWELMFACVNQRYEAPFQEFKFADERALWFNVPQGLRPTIPNGAPFEFAQLHKNCVNAQPDLRPTTKQVAALLGKMKNDALNSSWPSTFWEEKKS